MSAAELGAYERYTVLRACPGWWGTRDGRDEDARPEYVTRAEAQAEAKTLNRLNHQRLELGRRRAECL